MGRVSNVRRHHKIGRLLLIALVFAIVRPVAAQTGNAANGRKIFEDKCVRCHDADGSGDTVIGKALKAADLRSADIQKKSDADFYTQIDKGKGNMPPFGGGLDKSEINDLIVYVRQLGKKQTAGKKR